MEAWYHAGLPIASERKWHFNQEWYVISHIRLTRDASPGAGNAGSVQRAYGGGTEPALCATPRRPG